MYNNAALWLTMQISRLCHTYISPSEQANLVKPNRKAENQMIVVQTYTSQNVVSGTVCNVEFNAQRSALLAMTSTSKSLPPFTRIKIISLGDGGVGKSCLIKRYCEQKVPLS